MVARKSAKKSETLEVRLPYETKTAFMARCRTEERSASEAIRAFIDDQLDDGARLGRARTSLWRAVASGAAGVILGLGVAAPSFAHSAEEPKAAFERMDRNHDRVLSYQEFRAQ